MVGMHVASLPCPVWLKRLPGAHDSGHVGLVEEPLGQLCKQEQVLQYIKYALWGERLQNWKDALSIDFGVVFIPPYTGNRLTSAPLPAAVLFEWNEYIIFMTYLWKRWASQGINRCCWGSFPSAVQMCGRGDGNQGSRCFESDGHRRGGDMICV